MNDDFSKYDLTEVVGDYQPNENNKMLTLTWTNIKSAIVYILLTAFIQIALYIIGIGDVYKLDSHLVINMAVTSLLVGAVSVVKNLLTTNDGNFLGVTKVSEGK